MKTLTIAKDREMCVAVRVRKELTQDSTDYQELVMFRRASNISDLDQLNDSKYHARTSGAEKCERQVRCFEFTRKVRDAPKEERNEWFRNTRRLASSDDKARCSSAHTTSITGLASDDPRRNQQKSSCVCNCIAAK